jgi:general stress protein 26
VTLDEIKATTAKLGDHAHLATVGADGDPDVVPVTPAWEGDTLWISFLLGSVKDRNIRHHPRVALSWEIDDNGDSVEIWGPVTIHDDIATKRRLWTGVFPYPFDTFAPDGPDNSPELAFIAVHPERAVVSRHFGYNPPERWRKA